MYQIFAALIFILIKDQQLQEILIDTEYLGHQASIKEVLLQLFKRFEKQPPEITFGFVGKRSNAHHAAIGAYREKLHVNITVKAESILRLLYNNLGNKKGWRPHSGRGNP